MQLTV